jgi:hypothetical protein
MGSCIARDIELKISKHDDEAVKIKKIVNSTSKIIELKMKLIAELKLEDSEIFLIKIPNLPQTESLSFDILLNPEELRGKIDHHKEELHKIITSINLKDDQTIASTGLIHGSKIIVVVGKHELQDVINDVMMERSLERVDNAMERIDTIIKHSQILE